ncbi:MAG: outer membrane protein assembly factor BamA [Pseudomonadota bacterium]|nr:outer membrane protein assembly factor BamA [Pseudomonadota bacterium]MED5339060.1 outer membrane protein assembly factor BamA [Pseudomonadota bacterium]MEE3261032.1 outer membrane protein assembly factor BamA [Pseudomonadota bacterium]
MSGGPKGAFSFVSFFSILLLFFVVGGKGIALADYAKTPSGYYSKMPSTYLRTDKTFRKNLDKSYTTEIQDSLEDSESLPSPYDDESLGKGSPKISVNQIRIRGNQRIEKDTILTYLNFKAGEKISQRQIDKSIKDLFATGYFMDVNILHKDNMITVTVEENPVINQISFEGNEDFKDETLKEEISLRSRLVYTKSKLLSDTKRLQEVYRRSGRFSTKVLPKIIKLSSNRINIVFEINEGKVTRVSKVNFIGNKEFSDSTLLDVITTKESRWYKFFSVDDTYDPDRVNYDRELLRRYYLKNGYVDFRVVSAIAELTSNKKNFFITFTVIEGDRYKVSDVDVKVSIPELDKEDFFEVIETEKNEWYSSDDVDKSLENIESLSGSKGYAFVDVVPRIKRDQKDKTLTVNYTVKEGKKVFVENIDIVGNRRTLDKIIRREFLISEGSPFSSEKVRKSKDELRRLGIFEKVEVETESGSSPDRVNVNVEVQERATGEFTIGAGYSTSDGPVGNTHIRERNLLGRGQDLKLSFSLSGRTSQIDLSFTEPYFMDKDLSAGFDLFKIEKDYQDESGYKSDETGLGLRAGYDLVGDFKQFWKYTLRRDDIHDVTSDASNVIKGQAGSSVTSSVEQRLVYENRNDIYNPTDGYFWSLGTTYAGLGGSVDHFKLQLSSAYYHSLLPGYIVTIRGKVGYVVGIDEDVKVTDRFFLAPEQLRGFDVNGVGPRDSSTNDSLGGNKFYTLQTELTFPIGLPDELGIDGRVFSDFGSVWGVDDEGTNIVDKSSVRITAGIGLGWKSPFGPVAVYIGQPIVKESDDKVKQFNFTFGTKF